MYPLYALPSLLPSGFTLDFRFYDYYHISCSYPALSLVFYSTSLLLLSYHNMSNPCLISLAIYLLASICLYSQHDFLVYDSDLSIHMCLPMHATWHSHHHSLGSSDSSGSSYPGLRACSVWILPVADLRRVAVAWISRRPSRAPFFQAPCSALEFFCYDSEPLFVLFILVHLLAFSYLRLLVI